MSKIVEIDKHIWTGIVDVVITITFRLRCFYNLEKELMT